MSARTDTLRRKRVCTHRTPECEVLERRNMMAGDVESPHPQTSAIDARSHSELVAPASEIRMTERNAFLFASFSSEQLSENNRGGVSLTLRRDPRNVASKLVIRVAGGDSDQLPIASTITIPAGQSQAVLRLIPRNDDVAETNHTLTYTFSASGFRSVTASIVLVDDEPPKFQNPASIFDTNNDGKASASDALQVVNALSRSGEIELDPSHPSSGRFNDVNGDYRVTAADALRVINMLARPEGQTRITNDLATIPIHPMKVDDVFHELGRDDDETYDAPPLPDKP